MRRYNPPFDGKRFLLNKNTGEIHDLDKEDSNCRIDEIKEHHIYMGDSYMNCLIHAKLERCPVPNGCFYCQPEKDSG